MQMLFFLKCINTSELMMCKSAGCTCSACALHVLPCHVMHCEQVPLHLLDAARQNRKVSVMVCAQGSRTNRCRVRVQGYAHRCVGLCHHCAAPCKRSAALHWPQPLPDHGGYDETAVASSDRHPASLAAADVAPVPQL